MKDINQMSKSEALETNNSARLPILKTYKIYINGKFPRTESGRYYELKMPQRDTALANVSHCSRKDFRDAVTAAREAFAGWSNAAAFNRSQILYRIAEMLEARKAQFIEELMIQGQTMNEAQAEVHASIDRLVYYAGWCDKYQQVFSSVNPVSSSHFNFSLLEPTGVVGVLAPDQSSLLGLVSTIAPAIAGGNTVVVLASTTKPLCAVTFSEVLHSSDVPAGVVNVLTGYRKELLDQFAGHMDVNAVICSNVTAEEKKTIQTLAVENLKRVVFIENEEWTAEATQSPYFILNTQEVKTTWHPIGI
jgi:acyl-CoA reductase-like NAD-dependent aldehyde dehydrogenase